MAIWWHNYAGVICKKISYMMSGWIPLHLYSYHHAYWSRRILNEIVMLRIIIADLKVRVVERQLFWANGQEFESC